MADKRPEKVIVIGVGNVLFKDEGVGVYATRYIHENYTFDSPIEVIDGACLGFTLMPYFQEYDYVVLVDTVSVEDTPGSIYRLPADEMLGLGNYRQTAHEVEIVEMLEICSLLEHMAEVIIIGIVPEDITSVDMSLTQPLREAFPALVDYITDEIKGCGIIPQKIGDKPLEKIIEETTQRSCQQ